MTTALVDSAGLEQLSRRRTPGPPDGVFPDDQRAAVYAVIEERRDVRRRFLLDPVASGIDVVSRLVAS